MLVVALIVLIFFIDSLIIVYDCDNKVTYLLKQAFAVFGFHNQIEP